MDKLHTIRATKGFSLDEELRAYDGAVAPLVIAEPPVEKDEPIDIEQFYRDFEERERAAEESTARETLNSRITNALRGVYGKIGSPKYSRRPQIVPLSKLPLEMCDELAHFMYAVELPEEAD